MERGGVMTKTFTDKRLPEGVTIYLNDFEEYVAVEFGRVAQICNINVRMGRTINKAVENYADALEAEEWRMAPYKEQTIHTIITLKNYQKTLTTKQAELRKLIVEIYQTAYNHKILNENQANRYVKSKLKAITKLFLDSLPERKPIISKKVYYCKGCQYYDCVVGMLELHPKCLKRERTIGSFPWHTQIEAPKWCPYLKKEKTNGKLKSNNN